MKNRISINFLASIITYGLIALINFFVSPYIVATAGEAAYGFVSLATTFTTYASIVSTAINSMSGRFVTVATVQNRTKEANEYFVSTLAADIVLCVLFLLIGSVVVSSLELLLNIPMELVKDVKVLFALVFLGFIINTGGSIFGICYFVTNRLYISSIRTIVVSLIRAAIIVILFVTQPVHIYYMGVGTLIMAVLTVLCNAYMNRRLMPFIRFTASGMKLSAVKEIASAGIWNSINLLGTTLTEGLDLLMCNIFLTPDLMGVMSLSKTVPLMLKSIMTTAVGIFEPETVNRYALGDKEGLKQYLLHATRIMRMVLCVPFGVFLGLSASFYALWLPDVNSYLLSILSALSLLSTIFSIGVSPVYNVFSAKNKMKFPAVAHLCGGVISSCMVIVLLKCTELGVFAVAGVSSVIDVIKTFAVILPFAAKQVDEVSTYFWKGSLSSAGIAIAVALPGLTVTRLIPIDSWMQLFLAGGLYAILAYMTVLCVGLSPEERSAVKSKIRKLWR